MFAVVDLRFRSCSDTRQSCLKNREVTIELQKLAEQGFRLDSSGEIAAPTTAAPCCPDGAGPLTDELEVFGPPFAWLKRAKSSVWPPGPKIPTGLSPLRSAPPRIA